MLWSYIHPLAEDQRLADAESAYNSSIQRSTGRSPIYTAYGFHPRTPADLYNSQASESVPAAQDFLKSMLEGHAAARAALQQAQQQQKEYHDRKSRERLFKRETGCYWTQRITSFRVESRVSQNVLTCSRKFPGERRSLVL